MEEHGISTVKLVAVVVGIFTAILIYESSPFTFDPDCYFGFATDCYPTTNYPSIELPSTIRGHMHYVQRGIEQYASDRYGEYPTCIKSPQFDWSTYLPQLPDNPYSSEIYGTKRIDSCILVDKAPAHIIAARDFNPFKFGGMFRYYVSKERSSYALIASVDRKIRFERTTDWRKIPHLVKKAYKPVKVETIKECYECQSNFVLHN